MELSAEEFRNKIIGDRGASKTRPLFDQSPYIVNADLTYDNPRTGSTVSLVYNIFGERLAASSLNTPDIYEQPVQTLDFVLSQRMGRHFTLKLTARNLLDPVIEKTYTFNNVDYIYSSFRRGRTFGCR